MKKHVLKKLHKKEEQEAKLPSISRIITEYIPFGTFFKRHIGSTYARAKKIALKNLHPRFEQGTVIFICLLFLVAIGFLAWEIQVNIKERDRVRQEKVGVEKEITYWTRVVEENKGYRDGYFKLALLEYRVGNREEARKNLNKAFEIDPNFKEGREFEKTLQN